MSPSRHYNSDFSNYISPCNACGNCLGQQVHQHIHEHIHQDLAVSLLCKITRQTSTCSSVLLKQRLHRQLHHKILIMSRVTPIATENPWKLSCVIIEGKMVIELKTLASKYFRCCYSTRSFGRPVHVEMPNSTKRALNATQVINAAEDLFSFPGQTDDHTPKKTWNLKARKKSKEQQHQKAIHSALTL